MLRLNNDEEPQIVRNLQVGIGVLLAPPFGGRGDHIKAE